MRYALAGAAAFFGVLLLGLSYHDTVIPAWQVVTGQRGPAPVGK